MLEAAAPRTRARWLPRVRTRERFRPYHFCSDTCSSSVFRAPRVNFPHCFVRRLRVPRLVFLVASRYRGFCRFPRKLAPRLRPARWLYMQSAFCLACPEGVRAARTPRTPPCYIISDCVRVRALDSFSSTCVRTPAMIFDSACRGLRQKPLDARQRVVLALAVVSLAVRASFRLALASRTFCSCDALFCSSRCPVSMYRKVALAENPWTHAMGWSWGGISLSRGAPPTTPLGRGETLAAASPKP